jgi:hypothetical protein
MGFFFFFPGLHAILAAPRFLLTLGGVGVEPSSSRRSTKSAGTSLGTPGMTADVPSTWASSNMTSINSKLSGGPFRNPAISLLAYIRFAKLITIM